jgi:ATP-dependent Clp protease ATP-binding subunit ClpA
MAIFSHQRDAFGALRDTAHAFFSGIWANLPHRPRFTRLVVGPTGSGKSHVVRELARNLGLPLLHLCASSWIPLGAARRART